MKYPLLLLCLWLTAVTGHAQDSGRINTCARCHGLDGNSLDPQYPRLAGQEAGYLRKQLRDFALGARRNDAMDGLLLGLGDEELGQLAQYFSRQTPQAGQARSREHLELGKSLYEDGNPDTGVPACAGCHQANGLGNVRFPRLAGQHAQYTERQLWAFKQGHRAGNRLMVTVAERLEAQEIQAVADYLASLPVR